MVENTMWLIAGFIALSAYLDAVLIQIDFPDPFGDPDEWSEGPEGPNINDYHDEDQPDAEKKEQ